MLQILQGVTEYEPRVVEQLLNFMYRHVADILQDAEVRPGSLRARQPHLFQKGFQITTRFEIREVLD